ncbi:hypothetical protein C1Y63_11135 [Corynebacterium sp. 13CS0277]|uniref:DUF4193 domain-containing protein n=1 Tax=Corynebacterium sp. 13CS0277 TaxID=2071994 RepID=UPI000D04268C|nr:DUF4193 domain-containing protein [Corynebacterium sp. 13CS0277]PRQ10531.1 hypothetical protein C1Y63_11135 [Corynebacterium sp. 13CS0277]
MATDYDAPRRRVDDDLETDSLEGLKAAENASLDVDDDGEVVESYDLPTLDLSGEDINVNVVPRRADEFTCGSCFIVQRRNRIDHTEDDGTIICMDCA